MPDEVKRTDKNREFLTDARYAIEEYLTELRLKIHPIKSQLFETKYGTNFLGFRILPDCIRVRAENLRRARRRIKNMQSNYIQGKIELEKVFQSIQSWFAHLEHGDTWQLRQQIFTTLDWTRE